MLFSLVLAYSYGQDKPVGSTPVQKKKAVIKEAVQEADTVIKKATGQAAAKAEKIKKAVNQSIPQVPPKPHLEKNKIKQEASEAVLKQKQHLQSLPQSQVNQAKEERQKIKNGLHDQKRQLKSTANEIRQSMNVNKLDSGMRQEAKKQVSQAKDQVKVHVKGKIKAEKEQAKGVVNELKKPVDFDLNMDNNGTQTKSAQKESLQRKLTGLKDVKLNSEAINLNTGLFNTPTIPKVGSPTNSLTSQTTPNVTDPKLPLDGNHKMSQNNIGLEKFKSKMDSISSLDATGILGGDFLNAKTIFSQKQLSKLRDSLGMQKYDSLYNKAALLASKKEVGKEDLLQAINKPFTDKNKLDQSTFSDKKIIDEAKKETEDKAKELDLRSGKLPQEVLEKLPPLSGNMLDSKYLKVIDSLRKKKLTQQHLKLLEKRVSENARENIFKKKPKFLDKTYFDGVIGVVGIENATIVQASPSIGYHFLPLFSVGVGPMISLQRQGQSVNSTIGIRSFAKAEIWKQRAYFQVEHQINPYQIDNRNFNVGYGNLLLGGGFVKSLYGKIGVNLSLLYRVNSQEALPSASPWVFRLGISTMNSEKK